jgi:hypothetical protein
VQTRQKLRTRLTAEAIVGGVTGPVHAPQELILGRHNQAGRLRIAGRTTLLRPSTAARLGVLLEEQAHAWPERLPAHSWGAPRTPYTRVRPDPMSAGWWPGDEQPETSSDG